MDNLMLNESDNDDDLIVLSHPGLSADILITLSAKGNLPDEIATKIDILLEQILDNLLPDIRKKNLVELIDALIDYQPENFIEYLWYIKITCCIVLLNEIPIELYIKQSQLLMHTFQIPVEQWSACPIKIHIIAETLFNLITNVYNLMFVIRQICNLNRLSRYVCTSLIWTAMWKYVKEDCKMFRMYEVKDILKIIDKIDLNDLEHKMKDLYQFLMLLSLFNTLVIIRKARETEYNCFRIFFIHNVDDVKEIVNWLKKIKRKSDSILVKKTKQNCLEIIEIIEFDLLNLLKEYNKEVNVMEIDTQME